VQGAAMLALILRYWFTDLDEAGAPPGGGSGLWLVLIFSYVWTSTRPVGLPWSQAVACVDS
jgi:hypothetical protein